MAPTARQQPVGIALDWRACERADGYDFRTLRRDVASARKEGRAVAVTLCARRLPRDLDPATTAFAARLARLADAVARELRPLTELPPVYVAIDEIGFLAFALARTSLLRPRPRGGPSPWALARSLARAAATASSAIVAADPRARLRCVEPVVDAHGLPATTASDIGALTALLDLLHGRDGVAGGTRSPAMSEIVLRPHAGDGSHAPRTGVADVVAALRTRYGVPVTLAGAVPVSLAGDASATIAGGVPATFAKPGRTSPPWPAARAARASDASATTHSPQHRNPAWTP